MSVLIEAHSKDNAFLSFYIKISQRGSKMKAGIACAHKLLSLIHIYKRIKSCGRLGPEIEGLMVDKSISTTLVYLASLLGS